METINDIVREMRESFNQSWHDIDREWARDLADRIEAAAERERRRAMTTPRTWEECAENARKFKEGWDDVY